MSSGLIAIIILAFLASVTGGIFVLNIEKEIIIENIPATSALTSGALTPGVDGETPGVDATTSTSLLTPGADATTSTEDIIKQAQAIISETKKFIEERQAKLAIINEVRVKSANIKGIYAGSARNFESFKSLLDETELNSLVIDIKESYGANLSPSLKNSIIDLHKKDIWAIARIVLFRDSSLLGKNPSWYLTFSSTTDATTTISLWQDKAGQYWLNPQNQEVHDYLIEFSKKAIDYGFDELQFDYIRYPDDYTEIPGEDKIKIIGDFFSKLSNSLREYKPSTMLSVDLFGYVATQFNSYGTGQRLIDAAKNFDYLSFMLYPSHFYGGLNTKGIFYPYPEVVENPYDVIYYSIASAADYLSLFGAEAKIRPWLQDFNLKADKDRGVFYDAEKVRLQIEGAENATSSGWLLWNPSYIYTKEAVD